MLLLLNLVKEVQRFGEGGKIDPLGLCTQGELYHVSAWFQGFQFQLFKNTYLFNIIMTGCLSDINDLRLLQLLHKNVQLMFGSPSL